MHLYLSCQQSLRRHAVPAYGFWEPYFKNGLTEVGHTWTETAGVDWAEGLACQEGESLGNWCDRTWSRVIDDIRAQHQRRPIDLFLSYLFPQQVSPAAIRQIRDLGIPCVNFFCDNVRDLPRVPSSFFDFDLHWVPEFKALPLYRQAGLPHLYAPMPVWVPPQQRTWDHPERYGVSFIGSRDCQRQALLAQVLQGGVALEIRGAAWQGAEVAAVPRGLGHQSLGQTWRNQWTFLRQQGLRAWGRKHQARFRRPLPDAFFAPFVQPQPDAAQYVEILQQSQITLGINRYPSFRHPFQRPDTYSRMRDIEAPMMGACYLTEWTEGLDHFYDLGQDIETYRTAAELGEKIQQLQAEPERRRQLRRRGQQRALRDHSVGQSLHQIGAALGLDKPALFVGGPRR